MEENISTSILVFTKNLEIRNFLKTLLELEGYKIYFSNNIKSLWEELNHRNIGFLIIDFQTASDVEACKAIRNNFSFCYIPIIVIVKKENSMDKIKGIYAGADDYVEFPFVSGELFVRIKANLWRARRDLSANPLTKLPGNVSIIKELSKRVEKKEAFCVAYADLDKFKEYNDYYGFEWGDRIIKHVASLLTSVLWEFGSRDDFLGHIGGDDFIFITKGKYIDAICNNIIKSFDEIIEFFYKEEDRKKGSIIVKNRKGVMDVVPIMTISIGVVNTASLMFNHVAKINQSLAELKKYAKSFPKSVYVFDRRKG